MSCCDVNICDCSACHGVTSLTASTGLQGAVLCSWGVNTTEEFASDYEPCGAATDGRCEEGKQRRTSGEIRAE